jgi:hypothetical protein
MGNKKRSKVNIDGFREPDKLDFWNFDDVIKQDPDIERLDFVQNEPFLPQHPFRLVINGASGSGKTNQLLNMLFHDVYTLNYHKVYLYAKDFSEDKYQYLIKEFEKIAERAGVPVEEIFVHSDKLDEIIDVDDVDKSKMNLVIFDDLVNERNQDKIKELYLRGRKKNCDMIYLSQYYYQVPKLIRKNIGYLIFFKPNTNREVNCLFTDWGYGDIKSFRTLVDNATEDHNFLFIDINNKRKPFKYRCGFLGLSKWDDEKPKEQE